MTRCVVRPFVATRLLSKRLRKKLCAILLVIACLLYLHDSLDKKITPTQDGDSKTSNIENESAEKGEPMTNLAAVCASLIKSGNVSEATYNAAMDYWKQQKQEEPSIERYLKASCEEIKAGFGVPYSYVTSNENNHEFQSVDSFAFRIAYSIVVHKNGYRFDRLLRALYRPQHTYCVLVAENADISADVVVSKISACMPNVHVLTPRFAVNWGTFNELEAYTKCMSLLLNTSTTWEYYINLKGQEFPIKTNAEIVRVLMTLNGSNAMEGTRERVHASAWQRREYDAMKKLGAMPTKGSSAIIATRAFVEWTVHKPMARKIMEIVRTNVSFPVKGEMLFATLNFNQKLGFPGGYGGNMETTASNPYINRLIDWNTEPFKHGCRSGKRLNLACVWGLKDLPLLTNDTRKELFVNELLIDFEPLTFDCLEHWLWKRIKRDLQFGSDFDTSPYASLPMIKNHFVA